MAYSQTGRDARSAKCCALCGIGQVPDFDDLDPSLE